MHEWSRVDAGVFHHFHFFWIARLTEILTDGLLPDGFYAMVEPVIGRAEPDLLTLQLEGSPRREASETGMLKEARGGNVVGVAPAPVLLQDLGPSYWLRTRHVLIRDTLRQDRVVAVVELVSPGNKDASQRASQFVEKTVAYLTRGIHLLIVDVHPPTAIVPEGFHALISRAFSHEPVEIPPERDRQAVSYQVLEDGYPRAHIVPLRVGDVLPEMPVFLYPERFVSVPLERAYNEAYVRLAKKFRDVLEA